VTTTALPTVIRIEALDENQGVIFLSDGFAVRCWRSARALWNLGRYSERREVIELNDDLTVKQTPSVQVVLAWRPGETRLEYSGSSWAAAPAELERQITRLQIARWMGSEMELHIGFPNAS
jgi:hypothetical protein